MMPIILSIFRAPFCNQDKTAYFHEGMEIAFCFYPEAAEFHFKYTLGKTWN